MRELLKVLIRIATALEEIVVNTTPADDTQPEEPPADNT